MPYTLKSTGPAADLVLCVAVDDDGLTVREFVSSGVNADMTVPNTTDMPRGVSSWKGVDRAFFQPQANGSFNYYGPRFGTTKPSVNYAQTAGVAIFIAFAGRSAASNVGALADLDWGNGHSFRVDGSGNAGWIFALDYRNGVSTTALPSDGTTKFSIGANHKDGGSGTDGNYYYGLESGSIATDGGTASTGWTGTRSVQGIGGADGQGNAPGKYHIVALFNRTLTTAEFEDLHDDWFGTLFEAPDTTPVWQNYASLTRPLLKR